MANDFSNIQWGDQYQPIESGKQVVPRGTKTTKGPDAKVTGDWFKKSKALVPQEKPMSNIKGIPAKASKEFRGWGPLLKDEAAGALKKFKNIPMASKIGGLGTAIGVADEAINTAKDFQTGGLSGVEKAARASEGVGRLASAGAGGGMGFQAGMAAAPLMGPLAPIAGGAIGAGIGYFAPEAARDIGRRLGYDVNLPSDIAEKNRSTNTPNQTPTTRVAEGERQNNAEQSPQSDQHNPSLDSGKKMLATIRQNQQNLNAGFTEFLDQAAMLKGLDPKQVRGGLSGVLNEDEQRQVLDDLAATPRQDRYAGNQNAGNQSELPSTRGNVTAQGQPGGPYTSSNARFQGLSGADENRPAMIRNSTDTENIGVDLGRGNYMMASTPNQRTSPAMQRVMARLQESGGLDGLSRENQQAGVRANEDRANRELLARDSLVSQLNRASTNRDYQGVQALAQGLGGLQAANSQRDIGQLTGNQQDFTQDLAGREMALKENAVLFDQNLKTIEAEDQVAARSLAKFNQQAQLDYLQSGDDTKLKSVIGLTQAMNQVEPSQWESWLATSINNARTNMNDLQAEYMLALREGKPVMEYKDILESQQKSLEVYASMFDTIKGKKKTSNR